MPPRLKHIEVENFKSYYGRCVIGPLKQFNAVTGPNGSGKSNLMDAISFVMGERTQYLRVKKLGDLIHGAAVGKPVSKSASVAAVFLLEEGQEIHLQRSVQGSASEYRINNNVVSSNAYLNELEKLGINVKAQNVLIYQGTVESIAMKSPKDLTALFEEISGSAKLKVEYEGLKQEMLKTQEKFNFSYQKKKGVITESKQANLEKMEAEKFASLKRELDLKLVEHQLFLLFHNEREVSLLQTDLEAKRRELEKIEREKDTAEQVLKAKKKEEGELNRGLGNLEQDIREAEEEISKKKSDLVKKEECVIYIQKKLHGAVKMHEEAQKAHSAHIKKVTHLEKELAEAERAKSEYEAAIAEQSQSQGRDIQLEENQLEEYYRLKKEAAIRSAKYIQDLVSMNRQQMLDQDKLDTLNTAIIEAKNKYQQKKHEIEEMRRRQGKLKELIRSMEQSLQEHQQLKGNLNSDINSSKERAAQIQKQLEDVTEQLENCHIDKDEYSRRQKKEEVLKRLKNSCQGVYDRMINMCQPIHERYNVAITKVFGKFLDAIVVDTEHTARQCIKYLREQMLEPETFLPLDYIQVQPLKERLRAIKDPEGVRLLYDVLKFQPDEIQNAVLFVTKNTLVCETPEDASKVAYDMDHNYNDAIALDGTYYQKSGLISGGSRDLARKARRWNEKQISQLQSEKEKLTQELRENLKKSRKDYELMTVNSQITGLEIRLQYARSDLQSTLKQIASAEEDLAKLSREIEQSALQIQEQEKTIQSREEQMREITLHTDSVEDTVFSEFCQEIGVANIRQYEKGELNTMEERKQKILECQKQISMIMNNLEFERSHDTQNNISRWERTINELQVRLESAQLLEQKQRDDFERYKAQLEKQKVIASSKTQQRDNMKNEIKKAYRDLRLMRENEQSMQNQVLLLEAKIEAKKNEKHNILTQCRMRGIDIPLLTGDFENIAPTDPSSLSSGQDNSSAQQYEMEASVQIDYSSLPAHFRTLKDNSVIKLEAGELLTKIKSLEDTLQSIGAPNLKANEKLQQVKSKLESTNREFKAIQNQNKQAQLAFEKVKQKRCEIFISCFEHVNNEIDGIYKKLTQNESAQACLTLENPEEPYLQGVNFNCVVPGKRFQTINNLSGGEKTMAALVLLFAIHTYRPAPFFVLDEIDAALDNTNIAKVAKYIREQNDKLQTIVISLKEELYSHADILIGICPEPTGYLRSQVVMTDLSMYAF